MNAFKNPFGKLISTLLLAAWCVLSPVWAQSAIAPAAGVWGNVQSDHGARTLSFKGTAQLMGQTVPVELQFFCSYEESKMLHGAIGFDLRISAVDTLKPFAFDDFEGPDAPTNGKSLMRVSIDRTGQAALAYQASPSGSYTGDRVFVFEVSEVTRKPTSVAKSVLKALTDDKAERLHIVITDPHNARRTLDLSVAVAERRGDFKALLAR